MCEEIHVESTPLSTMEHQTLQQQADLADQHFEGKMINWDRGVGRREVHENCFELDSTRDT